jgi:hypothetical protein
MADTIQYITLAAIAFLGLILWSTNNRQAASLKKMAKSMQNLINVQIRNRRDALKKQASDVQYLEWIQKQAGAKFALTEIQDKSLDPAWVNLRGTAGRVVVSPLEYDELKKLVQPNKKLRFSDAEEALLGTRKDKVKVTIGSLETNEVFDLEAKIIGQRVGVDWGEVSQLTFVVIG